MTNKTQLTANQAKWVFDRIAQLADQAREACYLAVDSGKLNPDPSELEYCGTLICTAVSLINQIGWLADHGGANHKGDAADWMLPPAYHSATKKVQQGGDS